MSKHPTAAGMDPEDAGRALMSRSVKKAGADPSGQSQTPPPQDDEVPGPDKSPRQESSLLPEWNPGDRVMIQGQDGTAREFVIQEGGVEYDAPPLDGEG